jgi:hypothetical protein
VITPRELASSVQVESKALAEALMLLVDAGVLKRVYKVTTPTGSLTEESFDDPREIPEKLPDTWNHSFETAESDIVPVFKKVA